MTLVLTGLANGFRVEAKRTVDSLDLDAYLVKTGAAGPWLVAVPSGQLQLRAALQALRPPCRWSRQRDDADGLGAQRQRLRRAQRGPGMPALRGAAAVGPGRGRGVEHDAQSHR